jgi:hypothetical protein
MGKEDQVVIESGILENEPGISVTIYASYKDFPVTFTKKSEGSLTPMIDGVKTTIDLLVEKGFVPISNFGEKIIYDEGKPKEIEGEPQNKENDSSFCSIHDVQMKKREGKGGNNFYSHARKNDAGKWEYCSGKGFK